MRRCPSLLSPLGPRSASDLVQKKCLRSSNRSPWEKCNAGEKNERILLESFLTGPSRPGLICVPLSLKQNVKPTWEGVVEPLERVSDRLVRSVPHTPKHRHTIFTRTRIAHHACHVASARSRNRQRPALFPAHRSASLTPATPPTSTRPQQRIWGSVSHLKAVRDTEALRKARRTRPTHLPLTRPPILSRPDLLPRPSPVPHLPPHTIDSFSNPFIPEWTSNRRWRRSSP